jgi:NAD(P)H-quinone oxidoreductase subunit 4
MTDSYRASIEALVQRENNAVARLIHPGANDLIRKPTLAALLPPARLVAPTLPLAG